jgi:hypothetical protein
MSLSRCIIQPDNAAGMSALPAPGTPATEARFPCGGLQTNSTRRTDRRPTEQVMPNTHNGAAPDEPAGTPDSDRYAAETAHHHPTKPGTTDDETIRRHAYEIWEKEGRPEGRHEAHWHEAEQHARPKSPPGR